MSGGRRNPFDKLQQDAEEPAAYIPPAASKAKRNREWEQKRAQEFAAYRGIPPELREQVKTLAQKLGVPVGDVVRAFLEHGLDDVESGKLILKPRLGRGKLTLYGE